MTARTTKCKIGDVNADTIAHNIRENVQSPGGRRSTDSASPGSRCFQKNLDANPEKSGFCGKSSMPAHIRFFPKPFIFFASAQLRLRWHSPCARRLQQEVADRKPGGCERPTRS